MVSRPVRITFVTTGLRVGGAETMLLRLFESLDRSRFELSVICLSGTGPIAASLARLGVEPVILDQSPASFAISGIPKLVGALRRLKPHIIQGWMYHANLAAALATPFLSARPALIWGIRMAGDDFATEKPLTRLVVRAGSWLSPRASCIVSNSRRGALTHASRLGYRGSWRFIPNGFDTARFAPGPERNGSDPIRVGMIARYHGIKDHPNFLDAAVRFSNLFPDARFVLAGEGISWQNDSLARLVRAKQLEGRIDLLGARSDIHEVIAGLDIATLSSVSEGFPNALAEAMSCAVPCAATDVGDSALLLGDTGIVVPPRDFEALCAAWRELANLGAARRRELGQKARQRILENFSIKAIAVRYEALYEDFAGRCAA
jgi:glycosyltransferase involved in cell wall biosynthesis